jgi:5'(3')-deoxyribonucleotidase
MIAWLDIDGVLADFHGGIHKALGLPWNPNHWPYKKGSAGWNYYEELDMSFDAFDQLCTFDLWANLEWMPDGMQILTTVERVFKYPNIRLLTTPMPNTESASGKVAWVRQHLPQYAKQLIITTAPKEMFAKVPDSILIDDCQDNFERWIAAGGRAQLVPRPWNNCYEQATRAAEVVEMGLRSRV